MMKRIEYKKGDKIGNYDYEYIKDIKIDKHKHRYIEFKCNKHNEIFIGLIHNIKNNQKACPMCKNPNDYIEQNTLVGPHKIKFIKHANKNIHGSICGFFECPMCKRIDWNVPVSDMKKGKVVKCRECFKTHGLSYTKAYKIWQSMVSRCYNKNDSEYKRYGGRGITVCDEWKSSLEGVTDFANWVYNDLKLKDSQLGNGIDQLTLDRKNSNGNYDKDNCRFANSFIQSQNTRLLSVRNTTGFRGISFDRSKDKWVTNIGFNGKTSFLGRFKSRIKTAKVYNDFVIKHKTDHPLNPIDDLTIVILQINNEFYKNIQYLKLYDKIKLFDFIFKHMNNIRKIKKHLNKLHIKMDNKTLKEQIDSIKDNVDNPYLTDYIFTDTLYAILKPKKNA